MLITPCPTRRQTPIFAQTPRMKDRTLKSYVFAHPDTMKHALIRSLRDTGPDAQNSPNLFHAPCSGVLA